MHIPYGKWIFPIRMHIPYGMHVPYGKCKLCLRKVPEISYALLQRACGAASRQSRRSNTLYQLTGERT